jgi:uncharacterized alkaline shock family protein YloU
MVQCKESISYNLGHRNLYKNNGIWEVKSLSETIQVKTTEDYGKVTFADEVVAIIAGLAATEVKGVAAMSGGVAGGIAEKLGRKNLAKGVKVEVGDKETAIDLFIIVDYGIRIPEVAWNIQESVKKAIESMTGLSVVEVNVHVQGVSFEKEVKEVDPSKDQ